MTTFHDFRCGETDDGWDEARCGCGWVGGVAPDIETAADLWGEHLLNVVTAEYAAWITKVEAANQRMRLQLWSLASNVAPKHPGDTHIEVFLPVEMWEEHRATPHFHAEANDE